MLFNTIGKQRLKDKKNGKDKKDAKKDEKKDKLGFTLKDKKAIEPVVLVFNYKVK